MSGIGYSLKQSHLQSNQNLSGKKKNPKVNQKVFESNVVPNFITFSSNIFQETGIHFKLKSPSSHSPPRLPTIQKTSEDDLSSNKKLITNKYFTKSSKVIGIAEKTGMNADLENFTNSISHSSTAQLNPQKVFSVDTPFISHTNTAQGNAEKVQREMNFAKHSFQKFNNLGLHPQFFQEDNIINSANQKTVTFPENISKQVEKVGISGKMVYAGKGQQITHTSTNQSKTSVQSNKSQTPAIQNSKESAAHEKEQTYFVKNNFIDKTRLPEFSTQQSSEINDKKSRSDYYVNTTAASFYPFHELVVEDQELHNNILNFELKAKSYNPSNFIKYQLEYNKSQEAFYNKTMTDFEKKTYEYFNDNYKLSQKKSSDISRKIKVWPSSLNKKKKFTKNNFSNLGILSANFDNSVDQIQSPTKSTMYLTPENTRLRIYACCPETPGWKPGSREGSVFVKIKIGRHSTGIIFSGLSHILHEDLCFFDFQRHQWSKSIYKGENVVFYGRFGHTACAYKNNIVIFGGSLLYNTASKSMECLNDVIALNPERKYFKNIKCVGDEVCGRYGHVAEIIENFMVVHGGLTTKGQYLSDVAILSLENFKWSIGLVDDTNEYLGVAHHASCYVSKKEKKLVNIYQEENMKSSSIITAEAVIEEKFEYEGVFMFGGLNEEGQIVSQLRILKIGVKPLQWVYPRTLGQPPEARYSHTMTLLKALRGIFIYGGRNDLTAPFFFNNGYVLNLDNMNWVVCKFFGMNVEPRSSHGALLHGTRVYIFGGVNSKGYATCDPILFEFDAAKVREKFSEMKIDLNSKLKLSLPQHKIALLDDFVGDDDNKMHSPEKIINAIQSKDLIIRPPKLLGENMETNQTNQKDQQVFLSKKGFGFDGLSRDSPKNNRRGLYELMPKTERGLVSYHPLPDQSNLSDKQKKHKTIILKTISKIY